MSTDFEGIIQGQRRDVSVVLADIFPDLVGYFYRRNIPREDAVDLAGDTVLEMLRKPHRLPTDEIALRQYSFGVARHLLSWARRSRAREYTAIQDIKSALLASAGTALHEHDSELHTALQSLKARDRELLLLVAWEGFGVAEAGAIMGIQPAAARKRYSRVRLKLREILGWRDTGVDRTFNQSPEPLDAVSQD